MSLTSYLFERHQAVQHHLQERLATWRAGALRRRAAMDVLEPRMLLSSATLSFANPETVVSANPSATVLATGVGDLNHDNVDEVVTLTSDGYLNIHMRNSQGFYTHSAMSLGNTGFTSLIVADLNGDHYDDVVLVGGSGEGHIRVLMNEKESAFTTQDVAFTGNNLRVAVADVWGDSGLDLVVVRDGTAQDPSSSKQYLAIIAQDNLIFTPTAFSKDVGYNVKYLAVGDYNADGVADVLTGDVSASTPGANLWLGTSAKNDLSPSSVSVVGTGISDVHIANLNNANSPDVFVARGASGIIHIVRHDINGPALYDQLNVGFAFDGVGYGDFDGDGNLDLMISGNGILHLFAGNGMGAFTDTAPVAPLTGSLLAGDFNGDGKPDVAVTKDGVTSVILNTTVVADDTAPTSHVNALPSTSLSKSFDVSWTGSDNGGGSGIASYDIYVSDNYGAWQLWKHDTTATSATFDTGEWGHVYRFYSVATDKDGNREAKSNVVETAISLATQVNSNKNYTYIDLSGDRVTIKLTGPGSMLVAQAEGQCDVDGIVLTGTTSASKLTFTVSGTASTGKTTTIGKIDLGGGQLGALSAANVDLSGVGITGGDNSYIKSISLRDVINGADITLTGSVDKATAKLTARHVDNGSNILIAMPVSSATFAEFGNGTFASNSIGTLSVTGLKSGKNVIFAGNFAGLLGAKGIEGSKSHTLGSLSVAGGITGGALMVMTGNIGTISAKSIASSWVLDAAKSKVTRIATTGDMSGKITALSIGTLSVGGSLSHSTIKLGDTSTANATVLSSLSVKAGMSDVTLTAAGNIGTVSAESIGDKSAVTVSGKVTKISTRKDLSAGLTAGSVTTIAVSGSMISSTLTLTGAGVAAGKETLGTLSVTQVIQDTDIRSTGNLGAISAKRMTGSTIYAGYTGDTLPTKLADLASPYTIRSVKVSGDVKTHASDSVAETQIVAGTIKTLSLAYPSVAVGMTNSIVAGLITSFQATTFSGGKSQKVSDTKLSEQKHLKTPVAGLDLVYLA